jgi:hypothetical protein
VLKDSEVKETIVVFGTTNSLELVVEGRKKWWEMSQGVLNCYKIRLY